MDLQFLHHSSFRINTPNGNILIDPFINCANGEQEKPLTKSPCKEKEFTDINLILITHEHYDHFDRKVIECVVKRENALVVGHESVLNELEIPQNRKSPVAVHKK